MNPAPSADLLPTRPRGAHRRGGPRITYVPQPPTREEKYLYYGRQRRWLFGLFFAAFAGVMYGMWRVSMHSVWTNVLYVLMVFQTAAVLISLRSSTRRRRRDLADHKATVAAYNPGQPPSVDVFLPSAGEPLRVLENTYRHVAALEWEGPLTVYVLDDSHRLAVRDLARRYGFVYLARPNRGKLKKAGNLSYGFAHSDGEFIHVFDADFAPRSDMTQELMPYFADPAVGIVQSPQFFDVKHRSFNWLRRAAGATQELFYRWVQPARDAVDAAICVGTNAIYRRVALLAGGGFAQIGHSEDVHTGVNMAKRGYVTRYVPVNLAKGICPDDFDGFANQQYRWCTGSMSLLASRSFHTSAMTWRQKACFWTGFLYYMTTALAVFVVAIPGLLMVWVFPELVHPTNYLPLIGSVLVWSALMPAVTGGRWTPVVVRVQVLIGFCHALALWDFARRRTAAWVPTGAAKGTPTGRRVLRLIRAWVVATQAALWAGIMAGVARFGVEAWWATVAFGVPSLYFVLPLLRGGGKGTAGAEPIDDRALFALPFMAGDRTQEIPLVRSAR